MTQSTLQQHRDLGKSGETVLDVRHLTKYFPVGGVFSKKQVHALEDVSFQIGRGQVVALVGDRKSVV